MPSSLYRGEVGGIWNQKTSQYLQVDIAGYLEPSDILYEVGVHAALSPVRY